MNLWRFGRNTAIVQAGRLLDRMSIWSGRGLPTTGMRRHHCIIAGTGRTGTTFLVQLLTRLGFETGFRTGKMPTDEIAHAGLEKNVLAADAPYVVKSPLICTYAAELLTRDDIVVDCAIIPVRKLYDAAESRRSVQRQRATSELVDGGLWGVSRPEDQEAALAVRFFNLVYELSLKDVPIVFIHFPRFARDPDYLYKKLDSVLAMPSREEFDRAFGREARPELISDFSAATGREVHEKA